jgi:hypothetical protein
MTLGSLPRGDPKLFGFHPRHFIKIVQKRQKHFMGFPEGVDTFFREILPMPIDLLFPPANILLQANRDLIGRYLGQRLKRGDFGEAFSRFLRFCFLFLPFCAQSIPLISFPEKPLSKSFSVAVSALKSFSLSRKTLKALRNASR